MRIRKYLAMVIVSIVLVFSSMAFGSDSEVLESFIRIVDQNNKIAKDIYIDPDVEKTGLTAGRSTHLLNLKYDVTKTESLVSPYKAVIAVNFYFSYPSEERNHQITGMLTYLYQNNMWVKCYYEQPNSFEGKKTMDEMVEYYKKYPSKTNYLIINMK